MNNSVILVDFANRLRDDGLELSTAIKEASATRLSPIALTTTTTVVGLLPLTYQIRGFGRRWAGLS